MVELEEEIETLEQKNEKKSKLFIDYWKTKFEDELKETGNRAAKEAELVRKDNANEVERIASQWEDLYMCSSWLWTLILTLWRMRTC